MAGNRHTCADDRTCTASDSANAKAAIEALARCQFCNRLENRGRRLNPGGRIRIFHCRALKHRLSDLHLTAAEPSVYNDWFAVGSRPSPS
jgi:hypothetical protein